jgi:hypothetical protein
MHPNGFTDRVMCDLLRRTLRMNFVVLVRHAGDFVHIGQVVARKSGQAREALEDQAQGDVRRDERRPMQLYALGFGGEAGLGLVLAAQVGACAGVVARFPDIIKNPVGDQLDVTLGAFLLEEALQLVVAIALGGHGPEFADDRHARRRTGEVAFDRRQFLARAP